VNICFLGDAAAQHLRRWALYFAGRGHDVHVISFNPAVLEGYDGVRVHLVPKKYPRNTLLSRFGSVLPQVRAVRRILKETRAEVVHCHSAGGYAWLGMLAGHHPIFITPWGNDILIDIRRSRLERFLTRRALVRADAVTCDGENMKAALVELGIRPEKIRLIIFGVDVHKFRPGETAGSAPKRDPVVLSTRTLTPVHDVATLIRAIPAVLAEVPRARFVIAGGGCQKEELEELSRSLGVSSATRFRGMIAEAEMIGCLQSADLYVSTSLSESGLAASTAEAMACELPVINTETGDIRLWLEDGRGGFIIPVRSPEILAGKIVFLLRNEEARNAFGRQNRETIEERNNYYVEMEKMERLYFQGLQDRLGAGS
jgi:glycosyltransferase involved in cell wall biosynthesis